MIAMNMDGVIPGASGLVVDLGVATIAAICLFTWDYASTGDGARDINGLGWWGDSYPDLEGEKLAGSQLWLLEGRKATADTLKQAKILAENALQWMVDNGYAKEVTVQVVGEGLDILHFDIQISTPDETTPDIAERWTLQLGA